MGEHREFIASFEKMGEGVWSIDDQIADPANEVVRCRDCIHCEEAINGRALCEFFSMEGHHGTLYPTVEWDGFCKWGERNG